MCYDMEVLNVKVDKGTKEKLQRLVRNRAYRNKSEAVRTILEEHIAEHPELFGVEEVGRLMREARKISDDEFSKRLAEGLKGPRTVAEMLAEERDRLL